MGTTMRGVLLVATLAVAASACGTSSSTSVNAPSSRCTVSATAQPAAVGAPGGSGSIIITTDRECAWEARSEADWLSLADATGRGDGSLRYTASGNPIVSERRGAVVVNGLRVEIGQAAAACAFALDRSEQTVGAAGGRHDVSVSAQAGCAWTARSDVPWITIAAGAAGQGAGVVSVSVAPNAGLEARSAVVTIAGQPHLVEQAAGVLVPTPTPGPTPPTDPNCGLTVSPLVSAMGADGGSLEVVVTASASTCTWTAASAVPWIVMEGGVGEVGSGRRRFIVAPNPTTLGRIGTLVIANSIVTVTQAPAEPPPTPTPTPTPPTPTPCSYAVTPNPVSVGFGGSGDIDLHIVTAAGCAWTATSQAPWITINSAPSGTGDSHLHISVTPTLLINGRTGTLVVAEQTVTVNQAGILNQEVTITDRIVGLSGSCPNRSFTLGGATIVTNDRTDYPSKGECGDLREGRQARVRGTGQPDGTILANRIDHIEPALPAQEDE